MGTETAAEAQGVLGKPCESMDPDRLYDDLIRRIQKYHPSDDTSLIRRAYLTAKNAHMDQRRKSGEPYVIHPVCVAIILADLELDKETIIAGLLHDVVEDTILNKEQLARVFGEDVALLVDGVTKLTQVNWTTDKLDIQAENLRKMFLAMAKDIRVILIKLADRLHNMRTLQFMKPEKQKEKAKETLEIYGPIADRLGISKIKVELDDLALRYLEPDIYQDLVEKVAERSETSVAFIDSIVDEVQGIIDTAEIPGTVKGRQKHYFSIYKKMVNQGKTFDQIYDLFAVRILVESVKDCYAALGVIHEHFKPVPGRFKDYIAMPKQNMYQSLHTTLIYHNGQPFEIQIRTYEMHRTAEYGIAAHWKYKESGNSANAAGAEDEKMNWLRQILEWQRDSADNKEFLGDVKNELSLFSDTVYAFTPTGDVKTLPMGSTPVDFAYAIHSAVGNRMVGARVNGKLVNIDYQIQSGDRIEIITSQNTRGPSRDWLKIVRSSQAKNKINQWFKSQLKEENIVRGKEMILAYCKSKGIDWSVLNKPEYQEKVLRRYAMKDWDTVLASIGYGGLREGQVVNKMNEERRKDVQKQITDEMVLANSQESPAKPTPEVAVRKSGSGIVVKGIHDLAVRFSMCCAPVPGDDIIGFVTRGRGISIHRTDCYNIISLPESERVRLIPAEWQKTGEGEEEAKYRSEIRIIAHNRVGLFVDISKVFTEKNIDILTINTRTSRQGIATVVLSFDVGGVDELRFLTEKIRQVEGVMEIERSTG